MTGHELPVHLGPGSYIDGGPFNSAKVRGMKDGEVVLSEEDGAVHTFDPDDIQTDLVDEIESDEPVSINGCHPDDGVATVYLPLRDGFMFHVSGVATVAVEYAEDEDELTELVEEATAKGCQFSPV